MKRIYYLVLILFMGLIAGLNYLVELNAYTPSITEQTLPVSSSEVGAIKIMDFPINPITLEEHCVNQAQEVIACHQLSHLQTGDILVSKSSHTLLFRHGHAGLVIDADEGLVLEARGYGAPSMLLPLSEWNYFPTVKVLRLKDADEELIQKVVETATTRYLDLPYNIFATKGNSTSTHCSDIVWKVFNELGYDLDGNGGAFVTPQDLVTSPCLYEVISYGFSDERPW